MTFPFYLTFGQTDAATLRYVPSVAGAAPVLSNIETTPLLIEGAVTSGKPLDTATAPITATLQISDGDSAAIQSATVLIASNYHSGHDTLLFENTDRISGVWNPINGKLTLSGSDTLANYQGAVAKCSILRSSGFSEPISGVRTLEIHVNDRDHRSNRLIRLVRVALLEVTTCTLEIRATLTIRPTIR